MRTFERAGISAFAPVQVLVMDDELELPDNVDELRVYFFNTEKNRSGGYPHYREGDSLVCFATEERAASASQNIRDATGIVGSALRFLILECQRERLTQLVVR